MLESISHIALIVRERARTAALLRELFSARVVERKDDEGHLETFVRLGGTAFRATPEIIEATAAKLQAMGREFIRARSNRSLYFFDHGDQAFELDAEDIDEELSRGAGSQP